MQAIASLLDCQQVIGPEHNQRHQRVIFFVPAGCVELRVHAMYAPASCDLATAHTLVTRAIVEQVERLRKATTLFGVATGGVASQRSLADAWQVDYERSLLGEAAAGSGADL
ncbi:MAG: hypothetical protein JOZ81_15860, partial [Chloroflexi bacterium]|nr:hypothetical protein [Chloroflexota bacterium]